VRELVQKNARFFFVAGFAALALRLFFVFKFPGVVDDSRLYANVAENWLRLGIYGVTDSGHVVPTLSRLPGYPAFLAAIFTIFGVGNFRAVLLVQVLFDLASCFLVADLARRMFSERAAKAAFLLAALCPFLANYAAAALTETLEIFFTVLAFALALRGLGINAGLPQRALAKLPVNGAVHRMAWLGCGLSVGAAILLRPDGGILLATIGGYLLVLLFRAAVARSSSAQTSIHSTSTHSHSAFTANFISRPLAIVTAGILLAAGAVAPLVPWTVRNLHTLHRFQPLAPRYANDSDELVMTGFNRWTKTWLAEYVSVEEIYWNVPGDVIDVKKLPRRAFDSEQQRAETAALFDDYDREHDITPELDARFGALSSARIHAAPLRYYVWLPALRIADMWLRPRTELLPPDPRWWEFNDGGWIAISLAFGLINVVYVALAAGGLLRAREFFGIGLFVLFLGLRSLFLGTLENPEPRYTLECYPVLVVLAAVLFTSMKNLPNSESRHVKN
jgi:hypothetical protein